MTRVGLADGAPWVRKKSEPKGAGTLNPGASGQPPKKSQSEAVQSCPTLCDPTDCSLPGPSVHGIFQQELWSGVPFPSPFSFCQPQTPTKYKTKPVDFTDLGLCQGLEWPASTLKVHSSVPRA